MSANEILENIYYDLERGYGSVRSLYEKQIKTVRAYHYNMLRTGLSNKQLKGETTRIITVIQRLMQGQFIVLILWI